MSGLGFCGNCGQPREPGETFCTNCGARFDSVPAGAAAPPGPPPAPPLPPPPPPPPSPQPAAWPQTPAPPAASRGSVQEGGLNLRLLPLAGAAAIVVGSFLPWVSGQGQSLSASDYPFRVLFDPQGAIDGGFTIGLVLLLLGIAGAVLSFLASAKKIRKLCGTGAVAIVVIFVGQLIGSAGDLGATAGDVIAALSVGVYVTAAGGFVLTATR